MVEAGLVAGDAGGDALGLTGLRLGPTRLSLAAGYLYDRVRKAGAYSTISASVDF